MRTIAVLCAVALAGCATTPEQARYQASQTSSYGLCSKLANAVLADNNLREAWANELSYRGENCSQYLGMIRAEQAKDAQINALIQQYNQPKPSPRPMFTEQAGPIGTLKRAVRSYGVQYCVYDKLGTEVITTIALTSICPATN